MAKDAKGRTAKKDSICRTEFQGAVDRCIASLGNPKTRKLATGLEPFDSITGGCAMGDVTAIVGESGSGKSSLLRCMALAASGNNHVLYVPLQDGTAEDAARKLIALEAGILPSALEGRVDSANRVIALEAGDRLKESDLGIYAADEMMFNMLLETVTEDFAGYVDSGPIEGAGFVLIDSLSMLDDGDVKSLVRALKGLAYGSDLAIVATVTGDSDSISGVADASCIIQMGLADSASDEKESFQVTVLKDSWGSNAGSKTELELNKKTLAVGKSEA